MATDLKSSSPAVAVKSPLKPSSPSPVYDITYDFRISRCAAGSFKNLWRLEVKTPDYRELIEIIDADMLTTVIDRIRYVFEQDGL